MLIIRKEAENEIKEAFNWYTARDRNLGRSFLNELERSFILIQENPEAYSPIYRSIRRALCRRFPYAVYFVREDTGLVVLAVLHQRRQPLFWKKTVD
ncbi:MAG: type II toxin-antitoxin system RelE/ParE family toxin [Candidatus Thiodiazotropha sp. (ex Ustalcina ferruginea)]|nr:type II toxin-antitoxin system RelE/ParE family toxin [Candidatus Thiodiazotropha sp. (ex Ustalcina ferruginea)]